MNNNLMISTCLEFGETGSMAKAQYEWDALEPECTTQKLQAFLDKLQNTAGKHFGTEAQQIHRRSNLRQKFRSRQKDPQ